MGELITTYAHPCAIAIEADLLTIVADDNFIRLNGYGGQRKCQHYCYVRYVYQGCTCTGKES